ncbi:hypothetical protein BKA93DRAFT_804025 [Sparassis latifolia]
MVFVIAGYFLTNEQMATFGAKRGFDNPDGHAYILNRWFRSKGYTAVEAVPVALRHRLPDSTGQAVCGTLIYKSNNDSQRMAYLRDCRPLVPDDGDKEIGAWLQRHGINAVWETVPDPYGKFKDDYTWSSQQELLE